MQNSLDVRSEFLHNHYSTNRMKLTDYINVEKTNDPELIAELERVAHNALVCMNAHYTVNVNPLYIVFLSMN